MAKRRRRRTQPSGALAVVRKARTAARNALDSLREEIRSVRARLEKLVQEERSFLEELSGAIRPGAGKRAKRTGRPGRRRKARSKRPAKAERFFRQLPNRFRIEDVRKLAGRWSGVSVAQWTRARRIRKVGDSYQKVEKKK